MAATANDTHMSTFLRVHESVSRATSVSDVPQIAIKLLGHHVFYYSMYYVFMKEKEKEEFFFSSYPIYTYRVL